MVPHGTFTERRAIRAVKEEEVIDFLQGHGLHWRKQGYVGEDRT